MNIEFTYYTDEGEEVVVEIPAVHEVCGRCEGHGSHLSPSIGQHAYSSEEFDEAFPPNSEEREHYFGRGGMYDVTCEECHGKRVVAVPDFQASWPQHIDPAIDLKVFYSETMNRRYNDELEDAHIRFMENGGWEG